MSDKPEPISSDEKKTFDMYHFFSRKDILLAGAFILLLLLWVIYHYFASNRAV